MQYLIHIAVFVTIISILAISLDLVVGFTGLLSVAHAAFYGIGAYGVAILTTDYGWNFFAAVPVAIVISMTIALLIGAVLSKFKGDYYALGSLGFNMIFFGVLINWHSFTHGAVGITGILRPNIFGIVLGRSWQFLIFSSIAALLVYLFARWITRSSFGRVLKAIREDDEITELFGYRTLLFKLAIFTISAGLASIAGALFATYLNFIDPTTFTVNNSIYMLSIIILGGLANTRGVVLGAVLLTVLPELLRFVGFPSEIAGQMRQLIYGLLLIVLMLYRPRGLMGEFKL